MKVIAIKAAFFNGARVRQGAVLEIPDKTKGSWFAPVDSETGKAAKNPGKQKEEPKTLSEVAKGGQSFVEAHAGKTEEKSGLA